MPGFDVSARGLRFAYGGRPVLGGVDLDVRAGEVVGVVGPNGAGKSTLLRLLVRLLVPDSGSVMLSGRDLASLAPAERARAVAYVPQETAVAFPFTAAEVVLMGRTPHLGRFGFERARDREAARLAMERTGVLDLADRPVQDLSSGERQRVFLARALAQTPVFLALDEPTAFLDLRHRIMVYRLLTSLARDEGLAVVEASHDLALAARFCDRVAVLAHGRVLACGPPAEVFTPAVLADAFGVLARVVCDPVGGAPIVIPD